MQIPGKVTRIVDADTLDIELDMGWDVFIRTRVRLAHIDAWETRGEEREKGIQAVKWLAHYLFANERQPDILVVGGKTRGKYGRWIAEVFREGDHPTSLGELLVQKGHAEYHEY